MTNNVAFSRRGGFSRSRGILWLFFPLLLCYSFRIPYWLVFLLCWTKVYARGVDCHIIILTMCVFWGSCYVCLRVCVPMVQVLSVYSREANVGEELLSRVHMGRYRSDGYVWHAAVQVKDRESMKAHDRGTEGENRRKHSGMQSMRTPVQGHAHGSLTTLEHNTHCSMTHWNMTHMEVWHTGV